MNYMESIAPNEGIVLGKKKNISWSKPPNGQFKLNIDGSINRDMKKVTTGRVLRDSNGKVNSSFTVDINCCLVVITDL